MNESHKKLYKKILDFYFANRDSIVKVQDTFGVGTDQPVINFFLQKENIDLKLLPYMYNMQDMNRKEILNEQLTFTKIGWVYHFNAIPDQLDGYDKTEYWMKRTYEALYE